MSKPPNFLRDLAKQRRGAFVRRARWLLVLIAAIPLCTAIGLAVAYHFLTPPQWSGEAIAFCAGSGVTGAVFLLILRSLATTAPSTCETEPTPRT